MLMPYLGFQGNCEEAFALYAEAFSGKIEDLSRWTLQTGPPALEGKVMHAHLSLGEFGALNGSDREQPVNFGDAITLIAHCKTKAQAQRSAHTLCEGGLFVSGFTPNPPPDDDSLCAEVRDRFGYTWWIVCPNE